VQFHATPDNPVPSHPTLVSVVTSDALSLRAAYWMPETLKVDGQQPKGTVCLLQGRAEFIEKYCEVIEELRQRGFAVVAFDWRGQGLSAREVKNPRKGHVRRFADFRHDLEAIRDQVLIPHMPEPHFALAHSMGGAIALSAAYESWLPFRRLVTTTPMVALRMIKHPRTVAALARILNFFGFGKAFVPGGGETSISTLPFKGNRLTSDPLRYARNAHAANAIGAGAIGAPTIAWLDSAFRFMKRFTDPRYALKIRLPTLIIAAGADPVCETPATERFAARLKSGHALVIPGARHEILMERDIIREQFWAAFDAFIPGSADMVFNAKPEVFGMAEPKADAADSAAEQFDGSRMDPAIAGGDNAPALGG
jgi:lysophospholipase